MILTITSAKLNSLILHQYFGVTFLGLIAFRVFWGFYGSYYSKFRNIIYSPKEIYFYLKGSKVHKGGHSPIGFLSISCFYIVIFVLVLTGLFSSDDIMFDGPLAFLTPNFTKNLTKIHNFFHYIIYFLIVLHIAAILFYQFFLNKKLINQMIDGTSKDKSIKRHSITKSKVLIGFIVLIFCLVFPVLITFVSTN